LQNSVIGAVLAIGGQLILSGVHVMDHWFYDCTTVRPVLIIGLESVVLLPLTAVGSGKDGSGIHENLKTTFKLLGNSPSLIGSAVGLIALSLIVQSSRALFSVLSAERAQAVVIVLQPTAVWVVQVLLHFTLGKTSYADNRPLVGEPLTIWSLLEFAGCVIGGIGVLINGDVIRIPIKSKDSALNETPLMST
jgi:hypothetical protein